MFHESDIVVVPLSTEESGMVALQAISTSIPTLVAREAGIAEALHEVEGGKSVIVKSDDAKSGHKGSNNCPVKIQKREKTIPSCS